MTPRHYCTYFDHRYLSRGLALHASLQRNSPGSTLWVLCLSDLCEHVLKTLAPPGLVPVTLAELEQFDPELAATRTTRSLVEYYFTSSPCFPRYLLARDASIETITYLDSDLYFFSSPEPVFNEIGSCSIGITPHRFTERARRSHGKFGEYNVGWVSFRRDAPGQACLDWWRQQCLAWCHDRLDGDRYADQKYLEAFAERFSNVHCIAHPGANLAPWNIAGHTIIADSSGVTVNGQPLVFFHFQGLRAVAPRQYDSNLGSYGAQLTPAAGAGIFAPYLHELIRIESMLLGRGLLTTIEDSARRQMTGWRAQLQQIARLAKVRWAALNGNIVRV